LSPAASRNRPSDKYPGVEPLPGYRLLQPLGRGGFGEVWKCQAPGGLQKAIKFVVARGEQFRQELAAFEQVRSIRHPYLLMLERVELVHGELVMVMELADGQIHNRYEQSRAEGRRGIPREELLGYLKEAAEALDMMSNRYGLQHLDVKPENLFLVAGHVKVGDYGLVRKRSASGGDSNYGFTPLYSAPEVLEGQVDTRSDQYSLALVYVKLLTGEFPYSGQNAQQLMEQHLGVQPNLSMLPRCDQPLVSRALSKDPSERFRTCSELVECLHLAVPQDEPEPTLSNAQTRSDGEGCGSDAISTSTVSVRTPSPVERIADIKTSPSLRSDLEPAHRSPQPTPRLGERRRNRRGEPDIAVEPKRRLEPVVSVDHLHGMPATMARQSQLSHGEFVNCVVEAAASIAEPPFDEALPMESVSCRFLSTIPAALIPFKLAVVAERWGTSIRQSDPSRLELRWEIPAAPKPGRTEHRSLQPPPLCGYEVIVRRPEPPSVEYAVVGKTFGDPDERVLERAQKDIPEVVEAIRAHLQNLVDRRATPRFQTPFTVLVYPQYSDGVVGEPIVGKCLDVSIEGVRIATPMPVRTEFSYLEFKEVEPIASLAILIRVIRTSADTHGPGSITVGRFRTGD
jgi:eukaryotic-like serine/threonine-protein kinase